MALRPAAMASPVAQPRASVAPAIWPHRPAPALRSCFPWSTATGVDAPALPGQCVRPRSIDSRGSSDRLSRLLSVTCRRYAEMENRKRPAPRDDSTSPRRLTRSHTLQRIMEDHGMEAMFTHAGDHPLWKAALGGSKDAVEVALRNTNSFTQTAVLFKAQRGPAKSSSSSLSTAPRLRPTSEARSRRCTLPRTRETLRPSRCS